jgi:hypothetical protein
MGRFFNVFSPRQSGRLKLCNETVGSGNGLRREETNV